MSAPNPFPPAAVAAFAAGLDEYRLVTPYEQQTSQGGAEYAASALLSSGWAVYIPPRARFGIRVPCPVCTVRQLLNSNGQVRRHGAGGGHPCPGSGAIPERQRAA